MPLYNYMCNKCSTNIEVLTSFDDNKSIACKCEGFLERQISASENKPLVMDRDLINARKHNGKM